MAANNPTHSLPVEKEFMACVGTIMRQNPGADAAANHRKAEQLRKNMLAEQGAKKHGYTPVQS